MEVIKVAKEHRDELELVRLLKSVDCQLLKTGYKSLSMKYFFCSCDPDQKEPICEECSKVCHKGHALITSYEINAICQCGVKCHKLDNNSNQHDNIYNSKCSFMEWSAISKSNAYWTKDGKRFCMFCANKCNDINQLTKHQATNDLKTCDCDHENHSDVKHIFKKMNELTNLENGDYSYLLPTHLVNVIFKSEKSYDNLYQNFSNYVFKLRQTIEDPNFAFDSNIAYSSFMSSLGNFNALVERCKRFYYFTDKIKDQVNNKFIFKLMEKKFDFKSQNIWNMKSQMFLIYQKCLIRRDFSKFPRLTMGDLENLHPLQRQTILSNVKEDSEMKEFYASDSRSNLLESTIAMIERLNNIKDKNVYTYEMLKHCYQICKIYAKFNLFDHDHILKFCLLNDEVIYKCYEINKSEANDKQIRKNVILKQLRALVPMTKSLLCLVYHYNDQMVETYLRGKKELKQLQFFHSKADISKIINKNCINILNFVRHHKKLDQERDIKKILIHATHITSISIDYPDPYLTGMRKLLDKNKELYLHYLSNTMNQLERAFFDFLKSETNGLNDLYKGFFNFEIKLDDMVRAVSQSIDNVFRHLSLSSFQVPPSNINSRFFDDEKILEENNKDIDYLVDTSSKKVKVFAKYKTIPLVGEVTLKESESIEQRSKILINKTYYFFSLVESLIITLSVKDAESRGSGDIILDETYLNQVLRFLYFFTEDNPDNCILVLSSNYLEVFKYIHKSQLMRFLDYLAYSLHTLQRTHVELSTNKEILRAIKVILNKISNDPESALILLNVIKILKIVLEIPILQQEFTNSKLRKIMKSLLKKNPILTEYRDLLMSQNSFVEVQTASHTIKRSDNVESVQQSFINKNSRDENVISSQLKSLNNYDMLTVFQIYVKFLKLVNYLFDGNATLNELEFLSTILKAGDIPKILKKKDLDLTLRVEILKFFRMVFVDVIIDQDRLAEYRSLFVNPITVSEDNNQFEDGNVYKFFHDLISVNTDLFNLSLESSIIKFELKFFQNIIEGSKTRSNKETLNYFENGIILPLYVFLNKFMSIIYNLKGYEYLKLYEMVVYFLRLKKFLIEHRNIFDQKGGFEFKQIFKTFLGMKKNKYSMINDGFGDGDLSEIEKDLEEIERPHFEILNYKVVYSYYEKHVINFLTKPKTKSLKDMFQKKDENYNNEKIKKLDLKLKNMGLIKTPFDKRVFEVIVKYENEKTKFSESSFVNNLDEQNVQLDSNYRNIILRSVFFLIHDKRFSEKYQRQSFWNLFKLLQYDTTSTQTEIFALYRIKTEALNFNFIIDIFIENVLSLIFASCNPSTTAMHEDYFIAMTIVKILKYLCEEHNNHFQRIFFEELEFSYLPKSANSLKKTQFMSLFDLMLGILGKIVVLAKWEKVKFNSEENSNPYFYDIFFVIIELLIEMVQGTEESNLIGLIKSLKNKDQDENIGLHSFLYNVKSVLLRDKNDSLVVYKVRKDIIEFIVAFLEEKSTPDKLILMISSAYNPFTIFETIVNTLKKLYIKSHSGSKNMNIKDYKTILFDHKMCEYFVTKYFNDLNFCETSEFEFSNRMYQYVKLLATEYMNEDALNIIGSINSYKEQQLIDLYNKKYKRKVEVNDMNTAEVVLDDSFYQNYFAVKFFESITRSVMVQKDKDIVRVLFTLNPLIPYLSNNTKNEFAEKVNRDTRYTKLSTLR